MDEHKQLQIHKIASLTKNPKKKPWKLVFVTCNKSEKMGQQFIFYDSSINFFCQSRWASGPPTINCRDEQECLFQCFWPFHVIFLSFLFFNQKIKGKGGQVALPL